MSTEAPEVVWMHNSLGYWFSVADECKENGDLAYISLAAHERELAEARRDMVLIAQGCFDYGGGYRSYNEKLAIFHHGIQTVVNALESFIERGFNDTQTVALYKVALEAAAKEGERDESN